MSDKISGEPQVGSPLACSDLVSQRAALQAALDAVDLALSSDDPFAHAGRFDRRGCLVDMTGQPQNCDICGAPNRREGAYLFCTKNIDHWGWCECTDEARKAVEEKWGSPNTVIAGNDN